MRHLLLFAACLAAPAGATDRIVAVGSYDRVRVEGPLEVRIATGGSPRVSISGASPASDAVEARVSGTMLTLRRRGPVLANAGPVVATLRTPALRGVAVIGDGTVAVTGMRTDQVDLSVAGLGTGRIDVSGLAADKVEATVIGSGGIALAGRGRQLRLSVNGTGAIDAAGVDANELTVRLNGPGAVSAAARYTAAVSTTGSGRVRVAGKPKCTVRAPAGSDVLCGAP